ncbi:MAG: hypothetical protein RLZZ238_536 [Planctomycetota bacterium]
MTRRRSQVQVLYGPLEQSRSERPRPGPFCFFAFPFAACGLRRQLVRERRLIARCSPGEPVLFLRADRLGFGSANRAIVTPCKKSSCRLRWHAAATLSAPLSEGLARKYRGLWGLLVGPAVAPRTRGAECARHRALLTKKVENCGEPRYLPCGSLLSWRRHSLTPRIPLSGVQTQILVRSTTAARAAIGSCPRSC